MSGRPLRGLFAGLFLGLCVDLDLAFAGVVRLDSVVLTIVPPALLVVGLILGTWAPVGRRRRPPTRGPGLGSPLPPPRAWPEGAPAEGASAPHWPRPAPQPPPPPI